MTCVALAQLHRRIGLDPLGHLFVGDKLVRDHVQAEKFSDLEAIVPFDPHQPGDRCEQITQRRR